MHVFIVFKVFLNQSLVIKLTKYVLKIKKYCKSLKKVRLIYNSAVNIPE